MGRPLLSGNGQTKRDKRSQIRSFSLIFADFKVFPGNSSMSEAQIFAENRRFPQKPLCPMYLSLVIPPYVILLFVDREQGGEVGGRLGVWSVLLQTRERARHPRRRGGWGAHSPKTPRFSNLPILSTQRTPRDSKTLRIVDHYSDSNHFLDSKSLLRRV